MSNLNVKAKWMHAGCSMKVDTSQSLEHLCYCNSDSDILNHRHSMDVGDSAQEISANTSDQVINIRSPPSATTLSPLTPVESTFEEEKSKERSNAKAHVEGSKNAVQSKLVATPNIEVEFAQEDFFKLFHGLFDILKSYACFHGIRPHNKIELQGIIPFYSCGDIWFDTGQDFRADFDVFLSTESEDLKQYEGLTSLITHTMLAGEDAIILEYFPYLFKQPSLPLVRVDFRDLTVTKKLKNGLHTFHIKDEQVVADVSLNNFVYQIRVSLRNAAFDSRSYKDMVLVQEPVAKVKLKKKGAIITIEVLTNFISIALQGHVSVSKPFVGQNRELFDTITRAKKLKCNRRLRDMYAHVHEKWTTHVELVMVALLVIAYFANEAVISKDNINSILVGRQCGARMYEARPHMYQKPLKRVVEVYDYKISECVLSYQLKQFAIVANKVILSVFNPAIVVDKNIKQEALASGVVNNLMEALIFSALKAHTVVILLIKEYPISLSKALGHAANLDLSKESTSIVGAVFYLDSNSGAVTRIGRNNTSATKFALEATTSYVPPPKLLLLYSNLEDKLLF
ncbi:hypothetical protein K7X08_029916 [Anisodus acutangulus]|uniref:Uncharacterized protein n=1 Tax=Anisodus acutangulus TaxID=402998 RepID=A0A9Q1LLN7_9SOLA|nr:hypothetical protein K7X08_029916 [Anisodus acutangulus]